MPTPFSPSPRIPNTAHVAFAAELMSEFGASCCPSLSAFVERLIDRQATAGTGR